jgi:hypothetical protein
MAKPLPVGLAAGEVGAAGQVERLDQDGRGEPRRLCDPESRSARFRRASVSPCTYSMTRNSSPSVDTTSQRRHDVGVLDARRQLRLVEEHGDELGVLGVLRVQALDGHGARETHRADEAPVVHGGHTAGSDLPDLRIRHAAHNSGR